MKFPIERHPIDDPRVRTKVRRMEKQVKRGQKLDHEYVFGGGRICGWNPCSLISHHDGDCSWWIGHLINISGLKLPFPASQLSTFSLAELPEMDPKHFGTGPGENFTIFIKNIPGDPGESHTFGELRGRFTECGGSDNKFDDGRPCWFHPGDGMGLSLHQRLAEFPTRIHIRGL